MFNMFNKKRLMVFALMVSMSAATLVISALPAMANFVPAAMPQGPDDTAPDITTRVVRVSYLDGTASIKRIDGESWEKLTANLPIVEGDTIVLDKGSRAEIQLDKGNHIRLDSATEMKFVKLSDQGIALSITQGSIRISINEFPDNTFFEVDAPSTTAAFQKAGLYRVDAGEDRGGNTIVAANNGGEARVYTADSGFTLRSGRYAEIYVGAVGGGDWEVGNYDKLSDDLDRWSADRDQLINKRLNTAYYDKYYDDDIYGADELNDYGEWSYTKQYGYVWRPFSSSIGAYSDWSPYRYGTWRWVPPYGWTWVNDEPWGWATYHYGRWVWIDNYWSWAPYSYYRSTRSWWRPALVVLGTWGNNICWYPLPWNYGYYNFNYSYYAGGWGGYWDNHYPGHGGNWNGGGHSGNGNSGAPSPSPSPGPVTPPSVLGPSFVRGLTPPLGQMPTTAVVTTGIGTFGTMTKTIRTAPQDIAKTALTKIPEVGQMPQLPTIRGIDTRSPGDVRVAKPTAITRKDDTKTGAAPRTDDTPLDKTLRNSRMYNDRPPLQNTPVVREQPSNGGQQPIRQTGVFDRGDSRNDNTPKVKTGQPSEDSRPIVRQQQPVRVPIRERENSRPTPDAPVRQSPPVRQETPVRQSPPSSRPSTPSYNPPTSRPSSPPSTSRPETSRPSSPPVRNDPPKSETSKPAPSDRKKD